MKKTFDKNKIKLAAFDIDGTIFQDGRMSEVVGSAIVRLSNSGVIAVLSTGRMHYGIPEGIMNLGVFRYGVLANGAFIWDFKEKCLVAGRAFERDTADKVLNLMDSLTDAYFVAFEKESCLTPRHLELLRRNVALEKPKDGSSPKEIYPTFENLPAHVAAISDPIYKMGCRFDTPEECADAAPKIDESCPVEVSSTGGKDLEITAPGVNKGSGVLMLCEHLGLDISNVIAFGDSGNDVALFEVAGFSVALENGLDSAKKAADYIAPSVYEDGVAKIIEEMFRI